MGVLSRRRSLLVKLVVVVTTAWFTVAFLLYTDDRGGGGGGSRSEVALPLRSNEVDAPPQPERAAPFREGARGDPADGGGAVLQPPQNLHGEMGKPVVLPANLSGEWSWGMCCLVEGWTVG